MKCLRNMAPPLIAFLSSWLVFASYITVGSAGCGSTHTNSTTQQICNLTLCELNVTAYKDYFSYGVEAFVLLPAFTHVLSFGFLTTAHFIDAVSLGSVVVLGYMQQRYIITTLYLFGSLCAFILFACRFVRNCMALRYKCTRFTNFIIDTKGFLHRNHSPVLVSEHGRVLTSDGPVEVKSVIIDGQLAKLHKTIPAEKWEV